MIGGVTPHEVGTPNGGKERNADSTGERGNGGGTAARERGQRGGMAGAFRYP